MKLYDSISVVAKFDRFEVETHKGDCGKYVRGKWTITLRIEEKDGKGKTSVRTMTLPFSNGLSKMELTGYAGGFATYTEKGKRYIARKDERWAKGMLIRAVEDGLSERQSSVLAQIRPPTPTKNDVLYCIVSDIDGVQDTIGFEEWADNFGFDSDSRKAESIYDACLKEAREFRDFMGNQKKVVEVSEFVRMIDELSEPEARAAWAAKDAPASVETVEDRFGVLREEANKLLMLAAVRVIKECPRVKSGVAAMGILAFYDKKGTPIHPDDEGCSPDEKAVLEEFLRQGGIFQDMFGPSFGPWRINQDGSIDTNW